MPSRWIPVAVAAAALAASAAPASAVVNSPPAGGHEVTVFPERDFVALDPMEPNTNYLVEVIRNGVVIGTADAVTGPDGVGEINHPGGVCWNAPGTPDILPGDVVRATVAGDPTTGDATATAGVFATQAAKVGSDVVIHGTASDAGGAPLPLANLEQRIVNPDLLPFVGKRDIRAPGTGVLSYDAPGSVNWTSTFSGLSGGAADAAVAGQTRILSWMNTNPAGDRLGITIFEVGEVGGPGFGGCPASARNAVASPGVLNAATLAAGAADVPFAGAAQADATQVDLAISDGTNTINATGPVSGGAWSLAVPAAQLATLADGPLTAVATYTIPGGTIQGVNLNVTKDTVAPGAPSGSPGAGAYEGTQNVVLSSDDGSAAIRYTTNGSEPNETSTRTTGQIAVSATQTLKAIAIDAAGNRSGVTSLDYTITPKPAQTITKPGQTIVVDNTRLPAKLSVSRITMRKTISRRSLRRSGLKANVRLAKGTEVLRVRIYRGKKLIATAMRFPGRSGLYTVTLKNKSVKRLRAGRYVLEMTPGTSRQNLGNATRVAFRVR